MKTREEIINNMCMTFRHDYGLEISEDDRMYTLMSGMTKQESEALYRNMEQVFDHCFSSIFTEFHGVYNGSLITMPKNEEHAKAMLSVAQFYLANQG
jgi:hypothetical protein